MFFQIIKGVFQGLLLGLILLILTATFGIKSGGIRPISAYIILSGSMEPRIATGSIVIVQKAPIYVVGDIISYAVRGNSKDLVTHRVVSTEQKTTQSSTTYITKGDANKTVDYGQVDGQNVIGKVIFTLPYIGYIANFTKTPQGFILFIVIPATIIVYEELKTIFWELKKGLAKLKKNNPHPRVNKQITIPAIFIIIPVLAALFVIAAKTIAYFGDNESSSGNILGAAADFGLTSPTVSPAPSTSVSPTPSPNPIAQTLVINEVLPDTDCSQGNTEAQWIEVYNGYSTTVNLKNFKITDGTNTVDLVTANNLDLAPGAFALLAHNSAIWNSCYSDHGVVTGNLGGQLNIDVGTLKLLDTSSNIIDVVSWGGSTGLNPTQNQSVERDPDGTDSASGDSFNAVDFIVRTTPQPGT